MNGSNITPMTEPSQFYTNLKDHILSAKERIFIAALYIGSSEKELVDTIHTALSKSNSLKVHILIDCLRGTRASKQQSSATLLLPLVEKYPDQVQISLYHTPDLTGLLKKALPQRFNESIGLMHLKVYGFDDSVMLSGANLSTDYFTNRQDRYIKFGDTKDLSDYYCDLLETVGSFSYKLRPPVKIDGAVAPYSLLLENTADPVHKTLEFKSQAYKRMQNFLKKYSSNNENKAPSGGSEHDTVVYPVIQMAPLGIRQDENTTLRILDIIHEHGKSVETDAYWKVHLTSGYFNFTNRYKEYILRTAAKFEFLTASPKANGFFNSKGVSKYLPPAYTLIERQFHREVKRRKRESSITIKEFERPDWTYHAKGLWLYLQGEKYPAMTMIGSPNFGYRSNERDLEAQAVVVTENAGLRKAIHQELELLRNYCEPVTDETFQRKERYVPYGVRIATSFVRSML
ncbi:hypothetical protein BC943DRAFT_344816 [Umbelopsis sp. AD052]|nr:hypothetical protein BC943DRAFT_344816 [Umbelopsis sp. AD052]